MGAASAASGTSLVEVDNSALYVSGNSEKLTKTYASAGNRRTWTFSTWVYRAKLGTAQGILSADVGAGNWAEIRIHSTDYLWVYFQNAGDGNFQTSPLLRDIGWYHIVVALDTTQAVAGNRCKIYINGERVTTFVATTNPSLNLEQAINDDVAHNIGWTGSGSEYLDGYLAETVFIDGLQLTPASFGQYDSTDTFWTPLSSATIKALTFGTNGFYLDNTTNAETDASGNGNNLTNNNTVTLSTHTPTNIEFLMSPIFTTNASGVPTLSNGNRTYTSSSSAAVATRMGGNIVFPNSGKWLQGVSLTDKDNGKAFGVWTDLSVSQGFPAVGGFLGWHLTTVMNGYNSSGSSPFTLDLNFTTSDQFWIAVDIDNSKVWLGFYDDSASTIAWYAADGGTDGNPATGDNPFESIDCSGMVFAGAAQNSKAFTLVKEADCPFTIPTGYSFLTTTNLASSTTRTHSNLEEYFDSTLYEGNGAIQRVGQFLPFTNSFTVANSALFNVANEEYFSRTFETPTDQDVWSLSWWMKTGNLGVNPRGIMGGATSNKDLMYVTSDDIVIAFSGSVKYQIDVDDPASFHHYYLTNNSGTLTFYIDGVSQGTASATQTDFNSAVAHTIGAYNGDANWFDGYMSQFVFVDGTVIALSAFGQVDTSTGRWVCKDVTTTLDEASDFGNNGFFLNFANSSDMGNDVSGNNHDFTNNNTVVQVDDSPTVNIATLNPNDSAGGTISNGNKTLVTTGNSDQSTRATIRLPNTGKYYWELNLNIASASGATGVGHVMSLNNDGLPLTTGNGSWTDNVLLTQDGSGSVQIAQPSGVTTLFTFSGTASINDKYQIAVDIDNHKLWFGINNSFFNSSGGTDGNPSTGANPTISQNFAGYVPMFGNFNTNQTVRFDSADWTYTQPTDYVSLTQDSLPTGESYQTAFSWIKNRDASDNHMLFDRVRGIYNNLHSNTQDAEDTNVNSLQRFLNGGVQVGDDVQVNTASESYVAWNWYMETTGSGSSNTDGSINTTSTLVDTNLSLSVSKYTGTGSNATIGHGLGVVPEFFMVKRLNASGNDWMVYFSALGATKNLVLNSNGTGSTSITRWNNTEPTSSVISLGTTNAVNGSSDTYVCIAFGPSQFTAIGSYVGNGNDNGVFVPTVNSLGVPIQPAWFLTKNTAEAESWNLQDTARHPDNEVDISLFPNSTATDTAGYDKDFVTGGFKMRTTNAGVNKSGITYVYMAFGTPIIDVDGRIITGR